MGTGRILTKLEDYFEWIHLKYSAYSYRRVIDLRKFQITWKSYFRAANVKIWVTNDLNEQVIMRS